MIEFLTLVLGLIVGPQLVELSVDGRVARVELRLDSEVVAELTAEPWRAEVDYGPKLAARELVAVAFDGEGRELDRAVQWVNVPRDQAEARLALERGPPAMARLAWQAVDVARPRSVRFTFDGRALDVAPERWEHFPLPSYDPRSLHFLRAELEFSDTVHAQAELVFGGTFGDQVDTELTAVPIRWSGRRSPKLKHLEGAFQVGGARPHIAAVERGPADVLLVRDRTPGSQTTLRTLYADSEQLRRLPPHVRVAPGALKPVQVTEEEDRLRLVFPATSTRQGSRDRWQSLPVTGDVSYYGGLFELLTQGFVEEEESPVIDQPLADAVAIAGLVAATGDRRRAVVLAVGAGVRDTSRFRAADVRGFLAQLGVPLLVLATSTPGHPDWPGAVPVAQEGGLFNLIEALQDLRRDLHSQRMVWLKGRYLTHRVRLSEPNRRVELLTP